MIEIYLLGVLNVASFLLLWFFSPLKNTLGKLFFKKDLTTVEFDDILFIKYSFLGKLLTCWICSSFWLSLIIGIIYTLILNLTLLWPLITFTTYPAICYIFYTIIKR